MLRSPTALAIVCAFAFISLSPVPAWTLDFDFTWGNPRPQGNSLNALAFEDASTGYAVGGVGATVRTANGAQTWSVETRFPAFQATLRDVIVLAPGQLLAAGQSPGLYRSTDAGSTWSTVAHPFGSELNHLAIIPGPGPVISAVGEQRRILRSTDGGATWELRPSPGGSASLLDQFWFNPTTGYIVGESLARRTTDGGLTWEPLAGINEVLGSPIFTEVKFADALNGWILEHFTTFRTTDGGNSWFERHGQIGVSPIYQEEAFIIDTTRRFVVTLLEGAEIWETTSDGVTWTQRYSRQTTRGYTDIDRLADGTLVVSSTDGDLLRSTNNGLTWTNFVTSPEDDERTTLTAIAFLPGGKGLAGGYDGRWLTSLDGGATWQFGTGPGVGTPRTIEFRSPLLGLIGGWGPLGQSKVARTTDGGATWSLHSLSATYTGYPQQIAFPTDQVAYVVTHGGNGVNFAYRSTDGGQTWGLRNQGVSTGIRLECVFFLDATTGFIGGGTFSSDAALLKTTDGGGAWTPLPEIGLLTASVQDMHWSDAMTGLVASYDGVSRTTNGGQTWSPVLNAAVLSLDFRDALHGFASSYFASTVWATTDGGITWEGVATPWEREPYDITAVNDGFFVCGGGSVILGAREAGTTGVPDGGMAGAPAVAGRLAVRVWPNPTPAELAAGALTFGIESPGAGPIDLRIYELSGRLVDAMTANAPERGTAAIAWPSSRGRAGTARLASGTYWIEARLANGERAHGRFVVLPGR